MASIAIGYVLLQAIALLFGNIFLSKRGPKSPCVCSYDNNLGWDLKKWHVLIPILLLLPIAFAVEVFLRRQMRKHQAFCLQYLMAKVGGKI